MSSVILFGRLLGFMGGKISKVQILARVHPNVTPVSSIGFMVTSS